MLEVGLLDLGTESDHQVGFAILHRAEDDGFRPSLRSGR